MKGAAARDGVAVLRKLAARLSPGELDALKFELSVRAARTLVNRFDLSTHSKRRSDFDSLTESLWQIHPFRKRVPKHGIAYRGRPNFMTDELLENLRAEAAELRSDAVLNFDQMITRVETNTGRTVSERLAASRKLHAFVRRHAGVCVPSYVTSYVYYDRSGHCSRPHVDNAFTGITAVLGLRNESIRGRSSDRLGSASIVYWPGEEPLLYRLLPGEMAIFFGVACLHGRTPVKAGETIHSLLMSFRPVLEKEPDGVRG